jgi:sec-independent protein translocase protein TatA
MSLEPFLALWHPSFAELMIIMVIALLLFGKRLPEVARSLGKGVVEFKKGIKGVEDKVDDVERQIDRQSEYQPPRKLDSERQTSEARKD